MDKTDDLTQIKELIEIVRHKVDSMQFVQTGQSDSIRLMKDQQSVMNKKLDDLTNNLEEVRENLEEVKETQEKRVLPGVTYIEANIKVYKEAYQLNNDNAKKLEKRVEALEDNAGISAPPELTLAEVS